MISSALVRSASTNWNSARSVSGICENSQATVIPHRENYENDSQTTQRAPVEAAKSTRGVMALQMPKASLRENGALVPSVYQLFAAHGISPWVADAMKRASRQ